MAFAVTNDFTSGTTAQAAQVNTNFGDIETELNAFPTSGALKDGAVSATAKLADGIVTWAKLAAALAKDEDDMASDSATAVASQQSIKAYVDANIGSANWTPTSYAGDESVTFPNGLIMKHGYAAFSGNDADITFASAFPTGVVSASGTPKKSTSHFDGVVIDSFNTTTLSFVQTNNQYDGVYWQAWGY